MMTLARSLLMAMLALAALIGAQQGVEAQFPRGLLAAPPKAKPDALCTIDVRPLSFGTYDPIASTNLDTVGQVIYVCNNQTKNVRIEMSPGLANQFDRYMHVGTNDRLYYNIYLDATRNTIWGNGLYGTDVYFATNPPNGTPVVVPAFGRIPARQDPIAGQYADIVHVVILF